MMYTFKKAVRDRTSLLISLAGSSSSGKTYSALRLATGLADGGKIAFIDTEAGRAKHYSDFFQFDHCDMSAPFRPDSYIEAIKSADSNEYSVIVIDSMSHEWAGEGGILDWQEEELDIIVDRQRKTANEKGWSFDEYKARDANKMGAWIKPKVSHKRMIGSLLQCRAHIIFCLRAEEKMLMSSEVDKSTGRKKTVIVPAADRAIEDRWQPICEKNFMYENTVSFLLLSNKPGVGIPLKLQEQHKFAFPQGQQINEECGKKLAVWANGGSNADDSKKFIILLGDGSKMKFDSIEDWKNWFTQNASKIKTPEQAKSFMDRNNSLFGEYRTEHSEQVADVMKLLSDKVVQTPQQKGDDHDSHTAA